ncbi:MULTISPECIES: CoA ester lyase [unclassified Chelatococcus]|uniref:HpcH/HpaI aldolase/citrate lyase family protein n=1 Tax=unclassified Chelatococcus TaxID=2638111 RepID=UPI001BCE4E2D|nr:MULTISPECIES: CoA ester lyase [unclassified Chelatococcus]MBS7700237.1 CoA ester lyase [Chelatococcus sp. YT9]MBX3558208.1 CoA ester lyase [Chelatococcus sp.]
MRPIRTLMFVPGHKEKWIEKIPSFGADAVVLDLEDSVPDALKDNARASVAVAIPKLAGKGPRLYVRTNRGAYSYDVDDLRAVVQNGIAGIFVAKAEDPTDVECLSRLIAEVEHRKGLPVGGIHLIAAIETAKAAQHVYEIASNPRVRHLVQVTAKGADLERNLGFQWTREGTETLYLRSQAVVAARAAGKPEIIGGMWQDVHDLEGLRKAALFNKSLGYTGEIVLHPSNVPVINEVFSPSHEEIEFYRGMIDAFAEAEARGDGATMYRGEHIDIAHVETAKAFLARWSA